MGKAKQSAPITKGDLLLVVTPLFDNVKETKDETRRLGVLMEQMNNKIDTALEAASLATEHEIQIKTLDKRLVQVETDVQILKTALIHRK